jgi:hypothetical protein
MFTSLFTFLSSFPSFLPLFFLASLIHTFLPECVDMSQVTLGGYVISLFDSPSLSSYLHHFYFALMLIPKEGRDCRRLVPHDVNVNVVTKVTKRSACNARAHVRMHIMLHASLYSMSAVSLAYPLSSGL